MSSPEIDTLDRLYTDSVDAANGYSEASKDSDGHSLFSLFDKMQALHSEAASELADELGRLGARPESDGSFMSTVHRSIMKLRSLVGGLDESVLSGLIDGEERNLVKYNEALDSGGLQSTSMAIVARQRDELALAIARMRADSMALKFAEHSSAK